jgi:DDE superfamily endonuclease
MAGCGQPPSYNTVMTVCQLSRDFTAYRNRIVAVRGIYFDGLRQECPQTCATGPWPSFVNLVGSDAAGDAIWVELAKAERTAEHEAKQGRRVEVWVTARGKLNASERRSPIGPCDRIVNSGFGHLGVFPAQIVAETFKLVARRSSCSLVVMLAYPRTASPKRSKWKWDVAALMRLSQYPLSKVGLVMDNYGTHKVSKVQAWLARHPRYHIHFTPTSGSWLNLVERLFAEVTQRCVRRGSHTAVRTLEKAMLDYVDRRNRDPKPFVWTADADLILGKVARLSKRISNSGH